MSEATLLKLVPKAGPRTSLLKLVSFEIMLECFMCLCKVSNCLSAYLDHLKSQHGLIHHYDMCCCSQGQCCRTFSRKYTFTDHLQKHHQEDFVQQKGAVVQKKDVGECSIETDDNSQISGHELYINGARP